MEGKGKFANKEYAFPNGSAHATTMMMLSMVFSTLEGELSP